MPAAEREAERWRKYDSARRGGADDATLRAMFGDATPINISPDGPWIVWGKKQLPNPTTALPRDGHVTAGGNVRAVQRRGHRAVITFPDSITSWREGLGCHETHKVDSISPDGTVHYRRVCKGWQSHTERTKVEPIEIAAEEAAGLRPGDLVGAWVTKDGRRGALIDAERDGMLVQVRGHRLRVKEPRRETRRR
jgi:hypothetical protein